MYSIADALSSRRLWWPEGSELYDPLMDGLSIVTSDLEEMRFDDFEEGAGVFVFNGQFDGVT